MSLPRRLVKYRATLMVLAPLVVVFGTLISLRFGAVPISLMDLISALLQRGDSQLELIIYQLRIPRSLLAVCVGGLMAGAGALTQGLFRNPLADPSLIGISAGAAAGASLSIVFLQHATLGFATLSAVSIGAFIGGIVSVGFVYRIATGATGTSVSTMLLAGIGITFVAGAVSTSLEFIADNDMLRQISLWRMGGLDTASYTKVVLVALVLLVFLLCISPLSEALNALLLGESEAKHLGIPVDRVKTQIIILVAAAVGVSVAMTGMIAFIGLVVPHIVRMLIGPDHRFLVPLSICGGALLLVVSDSFARTIASPIELPVGLVTTAIGVPIFISLLRHRHHYGMQ